MAAAYPDDVYVQRTLENVTGVVFDDTKTTRLFAEDVIELGDEVSAIETELGVDPKGTFDDVAARLTSLEANGSDNQIQVKESGVLAGTSSFTWNPSTFTLGLHNPNEGNSSIEISRLDGITLKLKSQDAQTRITFPGGDLLFDVDDSGTLALALKNSGRVGVGTASPTGVFDVADNKIRVRTAKTPSSASATGNQGEVCWDSSYIYICTATNTWKRVAIATW